MLGNTNKSNPGIIPLMLHIPSVMSIGNLISKKNPKLTTLTYYGGPYVLTEYMTITRQSDGKWIISYTDKTDYLGMTFDNLREAKNALKRFGMVPNKLHNNPPSPIKREYRYTTSIDERSDGYYWAVNDSKTGQAIIVGVEPNKNLARIESTRAIYAIENKRENPRITKITHKMLLDLEGDLNWSRRNAPDKVAKLEERIRKLQLQFDTQNMKDERRNYYNPGLGQQADIAKNKVHDILFRLGLWAGQDGLNVYSIYSALSPKNIEWNKAEHDRVIDIFNSHPELKSAYNKWNELEHKKSQERIKWENEDDEAEDEEEDEEENPNTKWQIPIIAALTLAVLVFMKRRSI